jgi:hypothetical protein
MMNSKHPDKDIDSIFKDAIDPAETEPSDKFWNRTFEDIIKRENNVYGKQMRRWKVISYTLGAAIIILAFYTFYIHGRINKVEKQITEVEKKEAIAAGNENINSKAIATADNKITAILNKQLRTNHENGRAATVAGKSYTVAYASNDTPATINKNINTEHNTPEGLTRMNPNNSNPGSNNVGADKNPLNSSYGFGHKTLPGDYYSDTTGSSIVSKNSSSVSASFSPDSSLIAQNEKPAVTMQNETTPKLFLNQPVADTLAQAVQRSGTKGRNKYLSHIFISALFSPELSDNIITDNNPSGNVTANNIKAGEKDGLTYTTGLKLGYDLSKHWSILTGAYYHASSFSILPTVVHAQWQGSLESYSIVTSAGSVEMPSYISQYTNGSINTSGNSSWAYMGIPLQARYDFLPGNNFDFYAEGGFATNILLQTQTNINWSTPLYEGVCHMNNCDGLQNIFFVYNMGIGATYYITKGLSIFAEPGIQGPITPISKNNPITTYPYVFDLTLGLTYHF